MSDINFEIIEHLGVITEYKSGWKKEINRVSWNGGNPKYDIRDWNPDHTKMSRGVTFTDVELENLKAILTM